MVKHVVATHNANNSCSNGRYQPCCPGAVEKLFIYVFIFLCIPKQIIWTQQIKQEINQSIVAGYSFLKIRIAFIFILLAYLEFQKDWGKKHAVLFLH